jgi:hypothetical protein
MKILPCPQHQLSLLEKVQNVSLLGVLKTDELSTFAVKLEEVLPPCFSCTTSKKMGTRREKMWGKYNQIRSSDQFVA